MWRMNRYYLSGAVGLAVCMFTAFLMLAVNIETRVKDFETIRESGTRKAEVARFLRLMVDCETAQRGFLLTGDPKYLQPYEVARQETTALLDRINSSYLGDGAAVLTPEARNDLRQLREETAARLNEISATLALYGSSSREAALALVRTDLGKDTMDDIRLVAADLERIEDRRAATATAHWQSGVFVARMLLFGGTLLNIALIVGSALLVNRDLHRREELTRQLERHADELENVVQRRTADLSALSSHLQNVAEREKAAIARELHDELGGLMIAAKMDVAWLEKHIANADDDIKVRFARMRKVLDDGLSLKRRVVETLRPTLLDNMGLVPAVKWIYEETCARAGMKCVERYPEQDLKLRDDAAIAVFRVVQESLTNIVKHAKAAETQLALWIEGEILKIEIRDNGVGMPEKIVKAGSHGLSSMRHRITSLGGSWRISSSPGSGTTVQVALPLGKILETGGSVAGRDRK